LGFDPGVSPVGATATAPIGYSGFSVGDGGLALTYAGFTIGGNVLWSADDGQVSLQPQGGVNAIAWVGGANTPSDH